MEFEILSHPMWSSPRVSIQRLISFTVILRVFDKVTSSGSLQYNILLQVYLLTFMIGTNHLPFLQRTILMV
jgi:hypothetical protein